MGVSGRTQAEVRRSVIHQQSANACWPRVHSDDPNNLSVSHSLSLTDVFFALHRSPSIDRIKMIPTLQSFYFGSVTPAASPASLHPCVHHLPSLTIFISITLFHSFISNLYSMVLLSLTCLPSSRKVSLFSAVPGRRNAYATPPDRATAAL